MPGELLGGRSELLQGQTALADQLQVGLPRVDLFPGTRRCRAGQPNRKAGQVAPVTAGVTAPAKLPMSSHGVS